VGDILLRDVPDDVVRAIDASARQLGVSRSEYLRRILARERRITASVSTTDFQWFSTTFADLADAEISAKAWQ
jgi:hypothetical protein